MISSIMQEHENLVRAALDEDLGSGQDITTKNIIPCDKQSTAVIRARDAGVLVGIELAHIAFTLLCDKVAFEYHAEDGDHLDAGQDILTIKGSTQAILTAERTALNFMTHLSGVATLTNIYVKAVAGTNAKILDTRKTIPGLRALQKYAVEMGGGKNHRMGLYDAVLIKDNHIAAAGGISQALDKVKDENGKIEIEVDTLEQLGEVLAHGGADIVLLDNMNTATLRKSVGIAQGHIITEASGGVSLKSVREIAETGVDYIAIGALTHSAPALDLGLDFIDE